MSLSPVHQTKFNSRQETKRWSCFPFSKNLCDVHELGIAANVFALTDRLLSRIRLNQDTIFRFAGRKWKEMMQHHPMDHVNGFQDQVSDVTKMTYYTTFTYTCRDVILFAAFWCLRFHQQIEPGKTHVTICAEVASCKLPRIPVTCRGSRMTKRVNIDHKSFHKLLLDTTRCNKNLTSWLQQTYICWRRLGACLNKSNQPQQGEFSALLARYPKMYSSRVHGLKVCAALLWIFGHFRHCLRL